MRQRDAADPLTVTVQLYDGSRKATVELPASTVVSEILEIARQKWKLGGERDYRVIHTAAAGGDATETELPEDASLELCGVEPDDTLTIYPVLVAGASRAFARIRQARLREEQASLRALAAKHPAVVRIQRSEGGRVPHAYTVELRCPGVTALGGGVAELGHRHTVHIAYPAGFPGPGTSAEVRFLTPLLHIHVYPNGGVCLGAVCGPDEPLDALVVRLVRLIQQDPTLLDPSSPANVELLRWTAENQHRFPLGTALIPQSASASRIRWSEA